MTEAWTQLSLTGDDDHTHYVRDEVLAIDARHTTNGERVADLARLGYLPEPVLDPTYGYGSMWTHHLPEHFVYGDLDPDKTGPWGPLDFTALPFRDDEFASVLYDPPYRFAGTPTDTDEGGHDDLYGTHVYRTKAEQLTLILDGAVECARVAREVLIVKCQSQVVANSVTWQPYIVAQHLDALGWKLKDSLMLLSYRPQPAGRRQVNARRNYSEFLVFVPGENISWV
jgi:hypothetical protein